MLLNESETAKIEQVKACRKYSSLIKDIKDIETQIEKFSSSKEVIISEHAILRYLEKVDGISLEQTEQRIFQHINKTTDIPNYKIKTDGLTFVVRDKIVVTVMDC